MRVVFFDAGGTLMRPRAGVGEIYARGAAAHGVRADPVRIERAFRAAFAAAPPLAFPDASADEVPRRERAWWRSVVSAALAGCDFADFDAFFDSLYDDFARPDAWHVFPDVIPVLTNLRRRGFELGVLSNFDARLLPLLEGLALAPFFDTTTFSSAAGAAKPDARIFAAALRLHRAAPAEAMHVGDSEREDVQGARAAGLRALLVRANGRGLEGVLDEV